MKQGKGFKRQSKFQFVDWKACQPQTATKYEYHCTRHGENHNMQITAQNGLNFNEKLSEIWLI
ncbi:MAG: hypothetical protein A2066_09715 [Bacteroidetes bacterium GWB2_41_8]|nr:MAG: hypothetical protein A2066_09715 [Bacteroidetes bacterium GWB2_41_8]